MNEDALSIEQQGWVIWLTGISGAGKTTLALRLVQAFRKQNCAVELLDGDVVRDFFEGDLGYSRAERLQNIRRIAFAAKLLADHGVHAIVANMAPYFEARDFIRRKINNYFQVYCAASLGKVAERDVKGLYGSRSKNSVGPIIGIDDAYDVPRSPDLVLNTDNETVDESLNRLFTALRARGIVG